MDTSTLVGIASSVAAAIAAWFAFRSAQAARRGNRLVELEQAARLPNVDVYLIRGAIHRLRALNVRIYDFHLRIANRSEKGIAISELLLEIEYRRNHELMPRLQVRADPDACSLLPDVFDEPLRPPLMLEAQEVAEGGAIFRVPRDLVRDFQIDRYYVVAVDTNGERWGVTSIGLNEQEHA